MVIGALALSAWGQPRSTMDFDFLIQADAIPDKLVVHLANVGFAIDSAWANYNPMIGGLQVRFRSGRARYPSAAGLA
jgi:hypothetical protein